MPSRSWRRRAMLLLTGTVVVGVLGRRSLVEVAGPSMEPTLWPGDRLLTIPAHPRWLATGQVVVLRDPEDPDHRVIKRITAVRGDRVEVRGDDPTRSTDGRRWGPVPSHAVHRIAITRWPAVLSPLAHRDVGRTTSA